MTSKDAGKPWYEAQLLRERAKRAARAIAEGRTPGRLGGIPDPNAINRNPEKKRAYNREWARAHYKPHPRQPSPPKPRVRRASPPLEPLPAIAIGHPLFDRARSELRGWERSDFDRDMDTIAADLVSEYVLAELDGRDGREAMALFRRRHNHDRKVLVYGLERVDDLVR